MAVKTSVLITVRTDLAHSLEAGLDEYLDDVAEGYDRFVAPVLEEGETPPGMRFHLVLAGRSVAWHRERLEGLDESVVDQSGADVAVSSRPSPFSPRRATSATPASASTARKA